MAHERKQIRDAVVAALTGETGAGARVFASRALPVRHDLPTILVHTPDEETDPASRASAPRVLMRTAQVQIEAIVTAASESALEDAIDAIALEVETAMDVDLNLDGYAFDSALVSTETIVNGDGDKLLGLARLAYAVKYESQPRTETADAARERLQTVSVQYDLSHDQAPADQASDLIEGLNTDPIALWSMEDASAPSTVSDEIGDADLTVVGVTPALVTGRVGTYAREFEPDGSAELQGSAAAPVSAAHRAILAGADYSFAMWLRPVHGEGPTFQNLIAAAAVEPGFEDLFHALYDDQFHGFRVGWGGGSVDICGDARDGIWTHLAVTYERIDDTDGTFRVYQDGELLTTATGWAPPVDDQPLAQWQMGGAPLNVGGDGYAFAGRLDHVGFYDRTLTAAQVAALAASP